MNLKVKSITSNSFFQQRKTGNDSISQFLSILSVIIFIDIFSKKKNTEAAAINYYLTYSIQIKNLILKYMKENRRRSARESENALFARNRSSIVIIIT